jgi:hypothetical protein
MRAAGRSGKMRAAAGLWGAKKMGCEGFASVARDHLGRHETAEQALVAACLVEGFRDISCWR